MAPWITFVEVFRNTKIQTRLLFATGIVTEIGPNKEKSQKVGREVLDKKMFFKMTLSKLNYLFFEFELA